MIQDDVGRDKDTPAGAGLLTEPQSRRKVLQAAGIAGGAVLGAGLLPGRTRAAVVAARPDATISGTIKARFWGVGPELQAWQQRIAHFTSLYPHVTVIQEHLSQNGYEEYPALLTEIASGNAPDVIRTLNFQPTQLVAQGNALLALDEFIARDKFDVSDFPPGARAAMKVNGRTYVIPENTDPYGLYYNVTAFKKAGLPDPYQQFKAGAWNEKTFLQAAMALKQKGGMRYGVAFESWNYDNFAFMGGGQILGPGGKVTINNPRTIQALQYFADLVNKYRVSPNPVVAGGAFEPFFQNGEVGMYLMGRWWSPAFLAGIKSFQWSTVPLPHLFGSFGGKMEVDALGIYAKTKNPEAAWAFVKTVTDRTAETIWSPVGFPSRLSVAHSPAFSRLFYNRGYIPIVPYSRFTPFTTAGSSVDTEVTAALGPLWTGQATAATAVAAASTRLKRLLKQS